ncbi:peptidoglycan recognition protein 6 [Poeciliopsis prolifica]|uniref:peptidoglycan recognition protein 6 n=1 Tax=Poeciliopsis prolifica TaxID=188132 RepID=UPI0024131F6A|nr:peptidoglycan recognition protein 6 [Poeciliopsis prolifica]
MDQQGWWKLTLALLVLLVRTYAEASFSYHMEDFIRAVKQIEDEDPGADPATVLKRLRRAADLNDAFIRHFLPDAQAASEMPAHLSEYFRKAVRHRVLEDFKEEGVVLTPDGTTVTVAPLLLGIEAGILKTKSQAHFQLILAKDLGVSFKRLSSGTRFLGPDGCWNNVTSPQVFTLSGKPNLFTIAQINGRMDGIILGMEISANSSRLLKLSSLLKEYYSHRLDRKGMYSAPRLISQRRRENFQLFVFPSPLMKKTMRTVKLQQRLTGQPKMKVTTSRKLRAAVKKALGEFVHMYLNCPPIISRCMWGAEPYRGTPTNLSLPLSFLFIHHTHTPSEPCLTFEKCSADMRAMQRFHQEDRGWDDIGYSFVAGSDGFIYEGRGWNIQGAHTFGQNSRGYGVSFIGDYQTNLPSQHAMSLVRDQLATCAVDRGGLVSSYTLQGHRDVVNTTCPGDAFYKEISGWKHFGKVKTQKP